MQKLNCFEKRLCNILKNGQIPQHIGFIMDGNRRHAKRLNLGNPLKGHQQGVKSLKRCLLYCRQLSVKMVSLYCFSIQNFNRSKQQVEGLMKLFLQTFDECSTLSQYLQIQQIKVNIIGKISLFGADIRECIKKIEERTQKYSKMTINLCFGYDSLWQAQLSISRIKQSSFKEFMNNLEIKRPLDILVRTANQKRLSNFMLPQCAYCHIHILKEHWPELNILSFIKIIMDYNYHHKQIQKQRNHIFNEISAESVPQQQNISLLKQKKQ